MLESLDALEEPPPFRLTDLTALLGFWLLPFWCLSQAISNLFVFLWPFSNSLLLLLLILLISLMTVVILGIKKNLTQTFDYACTSYYWMAWMICVIVAPELDDLYYAMIDAKLNLDLNLGLNGINQDLFSGIIYSIVYHILPALSLFFIRRLSFGSYNAYYYPPSISSFTAILVENTTIIAALLIWDPGLSDDTWIFCTLSSVLYYILPHPQRSKANQRNNLATKLSWAKPSSGVASTTRNPLTVLGKC